MTAALELVYDASEREVDASENDEMKEVLVSVLSETVGYSTAQAYNGKYGIDLLAKHLPAIKAAMSNCGHDAEEKPWSCLLQKLEDFIKEMKEQLGDKIAKGQLEFSDIPYFLTEGDEVITTIDGQPIGGIVQGVEYQTSFFSGPYYDVKISVFGNLTGALSEMVFTARVPSWRGLQNISKVGVEPINNEMRAMLKQRGEKYIKYAKNASYVFYDGQLTRCGWWSDQNFNARGRVMIDIASFIQIDSDQHDNQERASQLDTGNSYDRNRSTTVAREIAEDELWRTYPFLYGFSFKAKQWGRMAVDGLTDINWRDDAWDKLVLPADEKELVKAIVEHQNESFSDIVDEKGGGSIFLLHGPPGQGKTLTAETIAEILHRPLYSISVGELGVSPDQLEETLRVILDVASIWNAVLLLDEADIFLEERNESDIVRNAMVGVFLRLLEYHQGVLFLTTNRVKNIDQAFYSRISIALEFEEADDEKRQKVWTNLLGAAGLSNLDIEALAKHDLNGRQIKNIIRLAQTLSKAKGEEVTQERVDHVIELTNKFKQKVGK